MPRRATGTVRILRNANGERQWHAKWTRLDGAPGRKPTRSKWVPLPPKGEPPIALDDKPAAQACAARLAPRIRAASANEGEGERIDQWARRHFAWREKQGMQTNADAGRKWRIGTWGGRWGKWISRLIGRRGVATFSRDDVETVREQLNEAVRRYYVESPKADGATSYKNAMHVWSCLTTACKQMVSADRDSGLRVRDDNPARDVQPPRRPAGMKKAALRKRKHLLRPVEFAHLLGCELIAREWRRAYAVLAYAYLRPGEARPLKWEDVDLNAGIIHVRSAWDFERERVKRTKSGASRDVPIEASLRPLLRRMRREANGTGLVLPCLSIGDWTNWSVQFRDRLQTAGIGRAELHEGSATEKAFGFRQLRDLGLTMRLWRGDNPLVVQRHAGHESLSVLQAYAVEFEHWTPVDGTPFAPLPAALLEKSRNAPGRFKPLNSSGNMCERRELKPQPESEENAGQEAISSTSTQNESPRLDSHRPVSPVVEPSRVDEPTDAELERALIEATLAKRWQIAEALAERLEERRRTRTPSNVIALRKRT